jgi:DNA-binding XRE family transcriptional regulator
MRKRAFTEKDEAVMKSVAKKLKDESGVNVARAKVLGRGTKIGRKFDLKTLRIALGLTQVELAERSGMTQGDVSRLESRDDVRLSTLVRHAEAFGGRLEVAVCIDGRRYVLDL